MFYTTIPTSKEQAKKLFDKHCRKIISSSFSYDNEDGIGFVTLKTKTGKQITYQLRNDEPMFIEFTGFGQIRYDINYPKELNVDLYEMLKNHGIKAKNNFWKGGEI